MSPRSDRIEALTALVGSADNLVEVGAHDGQVTIAAVSQGVTRAIAIDRSPESCALARERTRGLPIEVRCADGLTGTDATGVLLIAGMGGRSIQRILSSPTATKFDRWVLGPQSCVPEVRRFVERSGWHLCEERIVEERGQFYFLLAAEPGESAAQLGPRPEPTATYERWLLAEERRLAPHRANKS